VVLLVDILPECDALRYIPACYVAAGRVLYHRILGDAIVDIPLFESLVVRKWPGASLKHLVKFILTPPCTTLSLAARFFDCFGQPGHPSRPDGVNGRLRKPEAIDADRLRLRVTMVARDVADALPDTVRILFENPLALYRHTTDAQMLLAYRSASHAKRWRLVTLCHCLHADHDTPTSMKPTDYLVFGYGVIPNELCDGSCPLSIPGTGLHRYVISNASRHPGQTRITGHLRQRVPAALFDYLDRFRDVAMPVDDSFMASALASGTVRFTPSESQMHQAARELYGLAMAVRAASSDPSMRGRRFRVRVDAMVTVWYFRNSGGRSSLLNKIYRFLWEQLRAVGSSIVEMVHVPGSQFVIEGTDLLSRPLEPPLNSIADRDEWRVEQTWFERIQDWAQCTFAADLFADRDNHRLPLFYSAGCCADAVGHPDCFANIWPPGVVLYAFPPIGLVPRLLQRALDTDAHVVLLVPDWPSQPWWPKLMSMTVSSWFVGRKPGLFERRTEVSGSWGYVAVTSPFYELRVCRIHASTAASTSLGNSDPTSGLRLTADAASSLVGPVALARNALVTAAVSVPPM
jgi:RNase P/RNase MRP subunit p29